MRVSNYILDEKGKPKAEPDIMKWARWFEGSGMKRVLKKTYTKDYEVSTVFLAMDYDFTGHGKPVLWETMVFERALTEVEIFGRKKKIHEEIKADGFFDRYTTKTAALKGHDKIVRDLQKLQRKYGDK